MDDVLDINIERDEVASTPTLGGITNIRALMTDDATPVAEIMRCIALEIVDVMAQMADDSPRDPLRKRTQKDLNDHIKALRDLQKTLTEAEMFSKRDSLNFDGPKFKYVFSELIKLFKQTMQDQKIDDDTVSVTMLTFKDNISAHEEQMRRELKKMEGLK
jgi:hypothetical protein